MNNLGRILRVYAKPRILLWQASVGTATAKRAKVSGSKKDTLPKSKAKSEPKETLPKAKAKSESKETLPKSKAKSESEDTLPMSEAKSESDDALPESETKSESKDESVKDSKKKPSAASVSAHLNADGTRTSVWLMKSEPDTFSIDDLINSEASTSQWEGVVSANTKE